ncbi:phenolic glucoside malonyltransferase 2-like [Abrus precatorius]|uniref:Phenolic glucoside malonyltransferase 2-like n=1 Tax=Abrus precatorius TaxID=3816 RepID=A0A8B8L1W6_ABRPR|nr:phenolic glucoside malonyltransferase 2-like [Abrus precatorius]
MKIFLRKPNEGYLLKFLDHSFLICVSFIINFEFVAILFLLFASPCLIFIPKTFSSSKAVGQSYHQVKETRTITTCFSFFLVSTKLQEPMKIVEVFSVKPTSASEELPTQTSLPLTFFDILWLRLPPVQRVFFYEFLHPTALFFDTLLPKLKHSLALALGYFFPLVGHLTWPIDSNKPIIKYDNGDTVSLTVAESDADFNHLAGTDLCEAKEIHHLLPHLTISHEQATVVAFQVTLFPNTGFSIGITSHHAVLDGQTSTSFVKSWAYLCRNLGESTPSLPPQLCPFYGRELIKDPNEIAAKYVRDWLKNGGPNNRSLMAWDLKVPEDATRGVFQLSRSDIEKLKQFVVSKKKGNNKIQLSTYLVTVAYAWVCRLKAEEVKEKRVMLGLNVDCRSRLDPPLSATYFGNCVGERFPSAETSELLGEDGLIVAVETLSEALETLKDGVLNGAENWSSMVLDGLTNDVKIIGIAGSPRFEVYSSDFGWGRPKKVEMVSIDKTTAFCLSDSLNGDGVEIGFVSKKAAIESFASIFVNGLEF